MITMNDLRIHKQSHDKQSSWWVYDARGIPLTRVCDECKHLLVEQYRPEVLGIAGRYDDAVEECIEPEDY